MEIVVIEDTPKKLVFEVKGAGHTLCNALKSSFWNNKHVKVASYSIAHPLVGVPKMTVETDGEAKPRKVVLETVERLQKEFEKARKDVGKLK